MPDVDIVSLLHAGIPTVYTVTAANSAHNIYPTILPMLLVSQELSCKLYYHSLTSAA
jgi:hypothetical protein